MKTRIASKLLASFFAISQAIAAPIAHYTFDSAYNTNKTADSIGSAFATLGGGVAINTSVAGMIGTGVLEMTNANGSDRVTDGAVTSNNFTWTNDARTITFWWKAKTPVANTTQGTFVSFGNTSASGTRFDIKEQETAVPPAQLRVEVQGAGQGTNPTNFDDGNWHFVAVTVPDNATFAGISWFAGVRGGTLSGDLNISALTQAVATGAGPLVFGDSIVIGGPGENRTPDGYLDEFRLYDRVLTEAEILDLYQNPGGPINPPRITSFTAIGGGVWELTLSGQALTKYEFRSSTTLDFTPGTLVGTLSQGNPGTDPGVIDGSGNFVTTDTNGDAKVRLTLTGDPKDFVRAVSLP